MSKPAGRPVAVLLSDSEPTNTMVSSAPTLLAKVEANPSGAFAVVERLICMARSVAEKAGQPASLRKAMPVIKAPAAGIAPNSEAA